MDHATLDHLLAACFAPAMDAAAQESLAPFDDYHWPDVDEATTSRLAAVRFDDLVKLTKSKHDAVRHFAAFLLAHSRRADAVPALVAMESSDDGDFFDHDYIYRGCAQLGECALQPLLEMGRDCTGIPQSVAIAALGVMRRDTWPLLHQLFEQGIRPPSLFVAYGNLGDPRALDDVFWGLHAEDEETRDDAVSAADGLLEVAAERGTIEQLDRRAWAARFVELLDETGCNIVGFPLSCLGHLAEPSTFAQLRALLTTAKNDDSHHEEDGVLEAIANFGSPEAATELVAYLDNPDPELATLAAALLMKRSCYRTPALEARCVALMSRHLLTESAHYAAGAVLTSLPSGMELMMQWMQSTDAQERATALELIVDRLERDDDAETKARTLAKCPESARAEIEQRLRD